MKPRSLRGLGLLAAALCVACAQPQGPGAPAAAPTARVLGEAVHTGDADTLRDEVLRRLFDALASAEGITVTASERAAYIRRVRESLQQDAERQTARRDELSRRLAAPGAPAAARETMQRERDEAEQARAMLTGMIADAEAPANQPAREQIADAFIRQWKIHAALHRRYGGRIGYQQGGPEPLDAVRAFLEERQARGDFSIADPALAAAFWKPYRDDVRHDFYRRGSREEAEAFALPPPWERPLPPAGR